MANIRMLDAADRLAAVTVDTQVKVKTTMNRDMTARQTLAVAVAVLSTTLTGIMAAQAAPATSASGCT